MERGVSSSVSTTEGVRERALHWFLLGGNRIAVAACLTVLVVAVIGGLLRAGLLTVGPRSQAATVFASGLTSGVVTLVTISLSINQFILSRVFGTPDSLSDRLDGTRSLRGTVEELSGQPASPNDPAEFLSLVATTLSDRASSFEETVADSDREVPDGVRDAMRGLREYGDDIDDLLESEESIVDVLDVVLGTEYAQNMTAVRHVRNAHAEALPRELRENLDAVDELLEAIAVSRQFFKTLSLQQDFARLSRIVVYTGLVALVTSVSLTFLYRTNSTTTIPPSLLPLVVTLGIGVIVSPFAAFIAYILRAATIARRTVSVGPFIPPEKQD
ncbi:hypothetical protein KTS45_17825 [Halomicroarcula limicola]|uniref:DUF4239 domain-containing protein n=1 Tax=Haloarcula limicola TaxID=1429915 RepID=A0A8J8C588_9EURY|nr:hypothetical protein [Halomicroarcula limicola]MBV0926067.1 hypothetical protein [Halomicroarcula limicola]